MTADFFWKVFCQFYQASYNDAKIAQCDINQIRGNADNSVTFIFVTSIDENGVHVRESATVALKYYPLLKKDLESILHDNGFELTSYYNMDALRHKNSAPGDTDFETLNWYGALFKKL